MPTVFPAAFGAVFEVAGYRAPGAIRAMETLIGSLSLPEHDPRMAVLERFRSEGYGYLTPTHAEELLLEGDDPHSLAIHALIREDWSDTALFVGELRPLNDVFREVLEVALGIPGNSPEADLVVEVASSRSASLVTVEALLVNLETLEVHGRPLSAPFKGFFSSERIPRQHRSFLSLAALTAIEADLTISQEEVYYTLLLDGMEFHDAAEVALAV